MSLPAFISLAALAVAIAGYLLNRRALASEEQDRHGELALLEQQVADARAAAQKQHQRDQNAARRQLAQLHLLQQQVFGQEQDRVLTRSAGLTVDAGASRRRGDDEWEWDFTVTNVGQAAARHVAVALFDQKGGQALAPPTRLHVLVSSQSETVSLRLPRSVLSMTEGVKIGVQWDDGLGQQVHTSQVVVELPRS